MPNRYKFSLDLGKTKGETEAAISKLIESLSKMGVELPPISRTSIKRIEIDLNTLSKEQLNVIREGFRTGLLLTDRQYMARVMGEELLQQLCSSAKMNDLIQATHALIYEDFKKRKDT